MIFHYVKTYLFLPFDSFNLCGCRGKLTNVGYVLQSQN